MWCLQKKKPDPQMSSRTLLTNLPHRCPKHSSASIARLGAWRGPPVRAEAAVSQRKFAHVPPTPVCGSGGGFGRRGGGQNPACQLLIEPLFASLRRSSVALSMYLLIRIKLGRRDAENLLHCKNEGKQLTFLDSEEVSDLMTTSNASLGLHAESY